MRPKHSRPRVAHDHLHLVTMVALIAMDGAIGAGRLFGSETAAVETIGGVISEILALVAEHVTFPVLSAAINTDHRQHRFPSPGKAAVGETIAVVGRVPGEFRARCRSGCIHVHALIVEEPGFLRFDPGQMFSVETRGGVDAD